MSDINTTCAAQLIEQLTSLGVVHFCASPGSRSTPLTMAAHTSKNAQLHMHYDERGIAFFALGIAKTVQKPVALIVTSGTATGNLLPAIMEGFHSQTPLIILTADRPADLLDTMANQTTDQIKMFGNFVKKSTTLPVPSEELNLDVMSSEAINSYAHAMTHPRGPVHLNCPFKEPFSGVCGEIKKCDHTLHLPTPIPHPESIEHVYEKVKNSPSGLIRLGGGIDHSAYPFIIQLAEKLGWPLLTDIQSSLRDLSVSQNLIPHGNLILKAHPHLIPNTVLHFGSPFLEKEQTQEETLIHVSHHHMRCDPHHKATMRIVGDIATFCTQLTDELPQMSASPWLESFQYLGAKSREMVALLPQTCEAQTVKRLLTETECENVFLANSLTIRHANNLFYTKKNHPKIFVNRGLSGIDGNIATTCGICVGSQKSTLAILGDLATLHDLNSLPLFHLAKSPLQIGIINNGGGGIFSYLPIKKECDAFEQLFATAHNYQFQKIADQFHIPYSTSKVERGIFEITTQRDENRSFDRSLIEQIKQIPCLASTTT